MLADNVSDLGIKEDVELEMEKYDCEYMIREDIFDRYIEDPKRKQRVYLTKKIKDMTNN